MNMNNNNETYDNHDSLSELEVLAGQTGPETMMLHPQEVVRAMEIKRAVLARSSSSFQPLSDFEYMQYAISCAMDETVEGILERMEMMEAFKQEYNIQDTVEEGVQCMDELTETYPGFLLSVEYLAYQHNYVTVFDRKKFGPATLKEKEDYRIFLGGFYYILQAMLCHLLAIRSGASLLVECMGTTSESYEIGHVFYEKFSHELLRWYPLKTKEIFCLNAPSWEHLVLAAVKKIMRPNLWSSLQLGHQIVGMEGRAIDGLYKMPTQELARQRVILSVQAFLSLRRYNMQTFRLPDFGGGERPQV